MNEFIKTVNKVDVDSYIKNKIIIIAMQRKSRMKCKQLAILELLQLLIEFRPQFLKNGPLGDVKGSIAIAIEFDESDIDKLKHFLDGAGYTSEFYQLYFDGREQIEVELNSINPFVWKGKKYAIELLHRQNNDNFRNQAPDRRPFLLMCGDGVVREIRGYRGDGTETGKRALPVEDGRLLFNLATNKYCNSFMDPFCGAGGIVYQARQIYPTMKVFSNDISAELKPGLVEYGAIHSVGPAESISLNVECDAIATEVPFSMEAIEGVKKGIINISNYMSSKCRMAIMANPAQVVEICSCLKACDVYVGTVFEIDRKGTDVSIILAFKNKDEKEKFKVLWNELKLVY